MIPVMILCGGMGTRLREETEYAAQADGRDRRSPDALAHHEGLRRARLHRLHPLSGVQRRQDSRVLSSTTRRCTATSRSSWASAIVCSFTTGITRVGWRVTLVDTGIETMTGARIKRALALRRRRSRSWSPTETASQTLTYRPWSRSTSAAGGWRRSPVCARARASASCSWHGDRVTAFSEKPQMHEGLINGGFFVFERRVARLPQRESGMCPRAQNRWSGSPPTASSRSTSHDGFWQCMDTYRDLQQLKQLWESGDAAWKTW